MRRRDLLGLGLSSIFLPRASWAADDGLATFVADGLAATGTPGLGVAVVRGGRTVFTAGYGMADLARRVAVTPDTPFHVASVSKVVTGLGMMLLMQRGLFRLDDPVAPHLDFPLAHPRFPDAPITFRHLLTHTAGIADTQYERTAAFTVQGDPTLPLDAFVRGYLAPGGAWYDANACFGNAAPGTAWAYSNVGIALLGYLAQRLGAPLDALTRQELFGPLGMRATGWRLADVAAPAQPYGSENGKPVLLPPTGYPDWPAGMLRSSARDFARLLALCTGRGTVDGRSYLSAATLDAMFVPQAGQIPSSLPQPPRQGLIWVLSNRDGIRQAVHGGSDPGAAAMAALDLDNGVGALAFANVTDSKVFRPFQKALMGRLLALGRQA
jgi:CubicO group peptidase (beta-lactamase class C family)